MKKRILSIFLTFTMLMTMMPAFGITASAEPTGTEMTSFGGTIASGTYYLSQDRMLTGGIIISENDTVTIDLNGYTLDLNENHIVTHGTLIVRDSSATKSGKIVNGGAEKETDNILKSIGGAVVVVNNGGAASFSLESGTIKNCSATGGGAVFVGEGTNFTLGKDAVIEDCSSTNEGGAVRNNKGTVTVAGKIENCTAKNYGGAIYNVGDNTTNATVTLSDGADIKGCSAKNGTDMMGGGIFNKGILIMNSGAVIENCTAEKGAGVHNDGNNWVNFTMNDGTICNNKAQKNGGGVQNSQNATFNFYGGFITGNNAKDSFGGGVFTKGNMTVKGNGAISENTMGDTIKKESNLAIVKNYPINLDDFSGTIPVSVIEKNGSYVLSSGAITKGATSGDAQYFTGENNKCVVAYNAGTGEGAYLETILIPTLYFGMYGGNDINRQYECCVYTNEERTDVYTGGAGTWSVEWVANKGMHLNLTNFTTDCSLQICTPCYINTSGTNTLASEYGEGLVINKNSEVSFIGNGTLNVSSTAKDALSVNANTTVDGPSLICSSQDGNDVAVAPGAGIQFASGTINDNDVTYPGNTLYLAKKSGKNYALYADEACKYEYAIGKNTTWTVSDVLYEGQYYAILDLNEELNKKIVFKQDTTNTYIAVLRVNGTDTKLDGFDAGEGTLTIHSNNGNKITVSGDIKARNLSMSQCNGLIMNIVNGNIIAAEKDGISNEFNIGSKSDENKVKISIQNGSILNEKGIISFVNSDVTIKKNSLNNAASCGINANTVIADASTLTVNDVTTGIKMYDPKRLDADGAMLSLVNGASINIDAKNVGIQGTSGEGGYYYNNVTVADTSTIMVKGGQKAVASAVISPVPDGKLVRSADGQAVTFTINSDVDFTTDYYYTGTTTPATALTLANITGLIESDIENGTVSVDDNGAVSGDAVVVTATPNDGYKLNKIIIKDKNGIDITEDVLSDTTITMPAAAQLPITVGASFKKIPSEGAGAYVVDVADSAHGKVTLNTNNADIGDLVTLTVKADKGYTLETLTVTDKKGREVSLTPVSFGESYTFRMPPSDISINATFMEDNTMMNYFIDVKANDYFYDAVLWAAENGITSGVDSTHFAPMAITTRAQMITFIWRAAGCPEPKSASSVFTDVVKGEYYEKAVIWGYENGYVKGISKTKFAPNGTVTRGQCVAILARMNNIKDEDTGFYHYFVDVKKSDYFNNAVAWAAKNKITEGTSSTVFSPNDDCQRCQIVTFIYRCVEK